MPRLEYDDLKDKTEGESSAVIRSRVVKARGVQRKRFEGSGVHCNAQMNKKQLNKYCKLEPQAEAMRLGSAPARMTALLKLPAPLPTLKAAQL